jgi:hypothetical protein
MTESNSASVPPSPRRTLRLRFRPGGDGDGVLEREGGAPIPVPAPDYDRALDLLRQINQLRDASGQRLSSLVQQDGFEPWWYAQDRLLRFLLVPLTQYLPLIELGAGVDSLVVENAPADWKRLSDALGGPFRSAVPTASRFSPGRLLTMALSWMSIAAFRLARRDTVFYIVDHVSPGLREDFRFSPLYRELERRGYRYAEYAHTLSPRIALENSWRRRRPVFFLESADPAPGRNKHPEVEIPAGPLDSEQRALRMLVPHLLEGCRASAFRQRALVRALKAQRATRAILFDDNRHNHELAAACHTLGIPVLGFQHGVFNQFHAGLMAYGFAQARSHGFDRYGVWSDLFRDRLLNGSALYAPSQVFVCGPIRPPMQASKTDSSTPSPIAKKRIRVLVVSEPLARKQEVMPYLRALQSDPRFALCLKLRPGESNASLQEYGLRPESVRLLQTASVYEAFEQVDVAVGTYSSVLYEAALSLIPSVWIKTSRAYGRELVEEGLADAANDPSTLGDVLLRAAQLSAEERIRRRDRIWGKETGIGSVRLLDEAERTLWRKPR